MTERTDLKIINELTRKLKSSPASLPVTSIAKQIAEKELLKKKPVQNLMLSKAQ